MPGLDGAGVVSTAGGGEEGVFVESLAVYRWARETAGLAAVSLDGLVRPVIEVCAFYGVVPWRLRPSDVDEYFAGPGRGAVSTVRGKMNRLEAYFAFLEHRYAAQILDRFGVVVCSPVDVFNRPRHRGDFTVRVPPSQAVLGQFFARWRQELAGSRKYPLACRDYVMAKIAYVSGVRAGELCPVTVGDVGWEQGRWGRFIVQGKGAGGSGPRPRQAFLFEEGRALLWWYMEEVRGRFGDDATDPRAPLWPSERRVPAGALRRPVGPAGFRGALRTAAAAWMPGPPFAFYPHLLRHACATHHYERGMSVWEVQRVLGHVWATTTMRYMAGVHADPETVNRQASSRAAERLAAQWGGHG
ncbi:tyrosine-type recombinase/integrase [Streptomyces sp. NPDC057757]|uniref:tyrosine-type recombinase/integrase n=1 Tax=Streptomyces sp. NPDC057757 TaxID=3346241 RepID=UPI0036C34278